MLKLFWIILILVFPGATVWACGDHGASAGTAVVRNNLNSVPSAESRAELCRNESGCQTHCCGTDKCEHCCKQIECRCCHKRPVAPAGAPATNVFRPDNAKVGSAVLKAFTLAVADSELLARYQPLVCASPAFPLFLLNRSIRL